jgi:hypothetical protein
MKRFPDSCVKSPCKYFESVNVTGGVCRKKPPTIVVGGSDHIIYDTVWPYVNTQDWCGEGEVKE